MEHQIDNLKVGDGVTICMHSDRLAGTIIARTPRKIWVQRDKATLLNGMNSGEPDALRCYAGGFAGHVTGVQRYKYEPDPNGSVAIYSRRIFWLDKSYEHKIKYVRAGDRVKGGEHIIAGRHAHHDFNF